MGAWQEPLGYPAVAVQTESSAALRIFALR
jgi:hypothetical protein